MHLLRRLAAGLLPALLLVGPAAAQLPDPLFAAPTSLYAPGQVYALGPQQADGKRVVAGSFTRVNGSARNMLVRLDAAGAVDAPFSQNVGGASNIYRVRGLPGGKYLLGANGGTLAAGGLIRNELLRLNADGTGDAAFDAGTGPQTSNSFGYAQEYAVQPDGKVVVVGYFNSFNGVTANGVVRLNANGSVDTGFAAGTGINVNTDYLGAVAVQADGKILVAGQFLTFNGQAASSLVRLNANGSIDNTFTSPLPSGANTFVEGLVLQPDGKVLVNGSLPTANGTRSLVRLLQTGALDPAFSTSLFATGSVTSYGLDPAVVLQVDGKIVVVGNPVVPSVLNTSTSTVARINADGTFDASFAPGSGPVGNPYTVGVQANGSVLVGGAFTAFNGTENPLGRLTSGGAPDPTFAATVQVAGSVAALVRQTDGNLLIGGNFTEINGQAVHQVARLSANGVLDAPYSAATGLLPAPVTCLALQPDGKVLAGTSRGVVRLGTTGSPDPAFSFPFSSYAAALALQADGRILLAGPFTLSTGGNFYNGLVRLSSGGTPDPTFVRTTNGGTGLGTPQSTDAVLVQPDGRIVVGGVFRLTGQPVVGRVVRYDATGALDPTFTAPSFTAVNGTSNTQNRIYSLALQPDGKILAGGNFGAVNTNMRYGVARLTSTGSVDAVFAPNSLLTGPVYSLALQPNGRVLLGGSFTTSNSLGSLNNLARVLNDGQTDASFGPSTNPVGTVRSVLVQPDGTIMLAGSFVSVGGQPALGVARIVAANVLAVAPPAAVAQRTAAWPVPAHDQLHIAPDLSAHPLRVELVDALGRPVRSQSATDAAEQTLHLEGLPAGLYLLRVHYAVGTVTRRIAVR